ncbi:hypothetical protein AAG747_10430 [Rapidithrix thailandica]|uniref:50S ribosomal protein L29 n=1 Tax=Rapidithrix thailandica TaxID=413964 RepID=A0AAW9S794_9BACT
MNVKEIEQKIVELKGKQADYFKKKKAERNPSEIEEIRKELNELKSQAKEAYKK